MLCTLFSPDEVWFAEVYGHGCDVGYPEIITVKPSYSLIIRRYKTVSPWSVRTTYCSSQRIADIKTEFYIAKSTALMSGFYWSLEKAEIDPERDDFLAFKERQRKKREAKAKAKVSIIQPTRKVTI